MNQRCCKECKYADFDADGCTCLIDKRSIYNAFAYSCDQFRPANPMTNADRIRHMTDEELAVEITDLILSAIRSPSILYGKADIKQIIEANEKWLKQKVKYDEAN